MTRELDWTRKRGGGGGEKDCDCVFGLCCLCNRAEIYVQLCPAALPCLLFFAFSCVCELRVLFACFCFVLFCFCFLLFCVVVVVVVLFVL